MEAVQARPKHTDIPAKAVAEKLADDVMAWLGGEGGSRESVIDDLEKAIAYGLDGYAIAKYLDNDCSWNVDADLVEILENAYWIRSSLHDKAVEAWVLACGIKPRLQLGTPVKVKNRATGNKVLDGQIVSIDEKRGTYTVCIEALGHVREGMGTTGSVLPFEDVERWTAELAEGAKS